jgi:RND family efflux transporter MFP subunit
VENAQLALDLFKQEQPSPEMVRAQADQALAEAEQGLKDAETIWRRYSGSADEIRRDIAAASLSVAQAELATAQAEWERVQQDPVPKGYHEALSFQENELELAQIEYQETLINVADIESAIADAQIVAPFDGVLNKLMLADGRSVEAFKIYAEVSDMGNLDLSATLTSDEMRKLEVGMTVTAEWISRPGEVYTGTIRYLPYGLSATADEDEKTTRITLNADPEEIGLSSGDLMRVTVVLEQKEDVLWLPPQALRVFESRHFVVVQEDGYQQRIDITIGIQGDDRTEIVEGLKEGQIVIAP